MTLGAYIREARKRQGLSLGKLAAQLDVSVSYVCDLELGHRSTTSDRLLLFASVLQLDADYLYYLKGMFPPDIRALRLSEEEVRVLYTSLRNGRPHGLSVNRITGCDR